MCAQKRDAVGCIPFLFGGSGNMTDEQLVHAFIVALITTVIAYLERLRRKFNANAKARRDNPDNSE